MKDINVTLHLIIYIHSKFNKSNQICTATSSHSSGTYLASQIKSLCPSNLNCEKSQSSSSTAGSQLPVRAGIDDETRKKQDSVTGKTQPSTDFPSKYGQKLRGGKSQIVTGRCLPFSFSNSIRSMFASADISTGKSQYSLPNGNVTGSGSGSGSVSGSASGSGSGSGSSSTISIGGNGGITSIRDDIPQRENAGSQANTGVEGGVNSTVGNRTAGLLTPRRWSSPTVRRASEDVSNHIIYLILFYLEVHIRHDIV
jgi:hypothetical protein